MKLPDLIKHLDKMIENNEAAKLAARTGGDLESHDHCSERAALLGEAAAALRGLTRVDQARSAGPKK